MSGPVTTEQGWLRLHPLTPLLRSGRFAVAILALVTQQGVQQRPPVLVVLTFLVGVVSLALLFGYLSWRATRYRLADGELQVDSGVVQRRTRRVPIVRLQSVDVVRPLLARALGLAELRLEVAGGGDTEAPLSYLSEDDAHRLRSRLLALSAGSSAGSELDEVSPEEELLVQVPTRALVVSVLLGAPALVGAGLLVGLVVLLVVAPGAAPAVLAVMLTAAIGTVSAVVRRLLNEYGFSVAESADGLRLRHGLLETRAQTIPTGRVQTVRLTEPLLWRRRGWVRVEVDVAGYGAGGQEQEVTAALLPVAPRAFALALVDRVLGAAVPPADRPAPPAARWRAPLSARLLAVGVDDRHLVATSGVLTRTTDVLPLAKVQSLRLVQGPWQRRLGLASVHADSAGRRLSGAVARHRDTHEAEALLADLTRRARLARR